MTNAIETKAYTYDQHEDMLVVLTEMACTSQPVAIAFISPETNDVALYNAFNCEITQILAPSEMHRLMCAISGMNSSPNDPIHFDESTLTVSAFMAIHDAMLAQAGVF